MNTLRDLHQAIGGALALPHGSSDAAAVRLGPIVTDSRQATPGSTYWALTRGARGPRAENASCEPAASAPEGTGFRTRAACATEEDEAFALGAAGAVVGRPVEKPGDRWMLVVDHPERALWQWAAWKRRPYAGAVIAVGGSAGRSTARHMIHAVLRARLRGIALASGDGGRTGLPIELLKIEPEHDYAVLELEAGRPEMIYSPASLVAAKIGVIAQGVGGHPGGLGDRTGIADLAAELLASLPAEGLAVLADDPPLRRIARECEAPVLWIGEGPGCDVAASGVQSGGGSLSFTLAGCRFHLPVWGRQSLAPALAAIAVGRALGLEMRTIAEALGRFEPLPGRCAVIEVRGATIIHDPCEAAPASVRAALGLLRDFDAQGRRIAVCGDLATDEAPAFAHRKLGREAVAWGRADLVFAGGRFARDVTAAARAAGLSASRVVACLNVEDLLPRIAQAIVPGDVVLLAALSGLAMERVVDALQRYPRRRAA